jgi:PIN domain nuclease of toxin-antitoxin system
LLLDTHVFLWWLNDDVALSTEARAAIQEATNVVHVSAASIWEAAIKVVAGRLEVGTARLDEQIGAEGMIELGISARHAWAAGRQPPIHNDPFDRLLVAQAQLEQLVLVTSDDVVARYDVEVLHT